MKTFKIFSLFLIAGLFSCETQTKFDKVKWSTKEDPAFPPQSRKSMLKDLQTNYNLIGMEKSKLINLLGQPDFANDSTLSYKIIQEYGADIDPVYTKTLEIKLTDDKTSKEVNIQEWKK